MVNELNKALVPPRGLFASGKFDQYKRDVPYATLAQAFQTLVRQILVKSEADVDHWRRALREALGPNGQLIVDLVPELEFVIGKQPPVTELPPQEARGRFQLVFRRFLSAFARPEHPLALFLDDLQWLDTATLELLERLVTDREVRHLLLIGAYRDNEVSSSHPLMRTLAAIRGAGANPEEIVLAPLGPMNVDRLIMEALRCTGTSAGPLSRLVHDKTGGNPFFAIQFLTELAEEGLLLFDQLEAAWICNLGRVRARNYADNVLDLMVGKLQRLSPGTQAALQQLACLGNVAETATLRVVFRQSEEEIDDALMEAVRAGLILSAEGSYAFLHDRIQEAAYTLIPESERAAAHVRIGQALLASVAVDDLAEHLFDVANQLNRGAALLVDHDQKVTAAAVNLRAGRKARASAAYASARAYFAAGMALLDEGDWGDQYALTFGLWLERAECEFLTGNLDEAERLIAQLLPRGVSKVDQAAVYNLKVRLHVMRSENEQAVAAALAGLRGFGIDIPAHPTQKRVQEEYEAVGQALDGRPIETLIDLPLMTDPDWLAAEGLFSVLFAPSYFINFPLCCVQTSRMVRISLRHGASGDPASAYAFWASVLVQVFHRHHEAYRFGKLACDLVEKHGFIESQAKVYCAMGTTAVWTQPIEVAIDFMRKTIAPATETSDPTFACFGMFVSITYRLLRNDPLALVWRDSEMGLDFVRKAKFDDAAAFIESQQRFIAAMQGRTFNFSTFSDAQFDEATFEAQLTAGRMPLMVCSYWILKLKARFLSRDYLAALAAADTAKACLSAAAAHIQQLDYFYYAALTVSALYESASAHERQAWRALLYDHVARLREWAETYPPTFADKHTLVLAEIARIEKRDVDALCLYEQAIHLARENGFVQNEGLAHELAAQYFLAQGLETAGFAHLRSARNCYDRWGASGKVKQLDERYPRLRGEEILASATTIGPSVGRLDVETVVRASQALCGCRWTCCRLIERLMQIALEHAGAERGVLILTGSGEPRIEAEAVASADGVEIYRLGRRPLCMPSDLHPISVAIRDSVAGACAPR